jgi:hypothetical protein
LVFVLPAAAVGLFTGFSRNELRLGRLLFTAGVFVPAVVLSIPLLFRVGKRLRLR